MTVECREGGGEDEVVLAVSRPPKASGLADVNRKSRMFTQFVAGIASSPQGLEKACEFVRQEGKMDFFKHCVENLPKEEANEVRETARRIINDCFSH